MCLYIAVMACKEIFYCSILIVGDHRFGSHVCVSSMDVHEILHAMGLIDHPRGHCHGGDNLICPINSTVGFVLKLCPASLADDGCVGIGS